MTVIIRVPVSILPIYASPKRWERAQALPNVLAVLAVGSERLGLNCFSGVGPLYLSTVDCTHCLLSLSLAP